MVGATTVGLRVYCRGGGGGGGAGTEGNTVVRATTVGLRVYCREGGGGGRGQRVTQW